MGPASTITLFTPPRPRESSSSWLASVLIHAGMFGWFVFGLAHMPRLQGRTSHPVYSVRMVDVPATQPKILEYTAAGSPSDPVETKGATNKAGAPHSVAPDAPGAAVPSPAPALPASIQLPQIAHQQQTLIQPDAPKDLLLQRPTPVPLIMMWAKQNPPKDTIASPPSKTIPSNQQPVMVRPNREPAPAPINLSATSLHTSVPLPPAGSTSPVVVHGPAPAEQMPTIATESNVPPAPVRILSLSDRQQQEGPVAVPLANASARPSTSPSLTPGRPESSKGSGMPDTPGKSQGATISGQQSTGNSSGQIDHATEKAATPASASSSPSQENHPAPATALSKSTDNTTLAGGSAIGSENHAALQHITLPKDGQFGAVVVGARLADQYPETAAIWSGRPVYMVYLHVGVGKSWILQYSLPAGTQAAASGVRPDAPWPYDLVVPKLDASDYNSDALMVHGFVNATGRFERLDVVLPPEMAKAKFVLSALDQWQFRAALQNGQPTPVEILLIIPAQDD